MKRAVIQQAGRIGDSVTGESEALVVREALGEYFAKRNINVEGVSPYEGQVMTETPSPKQTVRYSGKRPRSKKKSPRPQK